MGGVHSDYAHSNEALALGDDGAHRVATSSSSSSATGDAGHGWLSSIDRCPHPRVRPPSCKPFNHICFQYWYGSPGLAAISAAAEIAGDVDLRKASFLPGGIAALPSAAAKASAFFLGNSPSILKKRGGALSSSSSSSLMHSPGLFEDVGLVGGHLYPFSTTAAGGADFAASSPFSSVAMKKRTSAAKFKESQFNHSIFGDEHDGFNQQIPLDVLQRQSAGGGTEADADFGVDVGSESGAGRGGSSSRRRASSVKKRQDDAYEYSGVGIATGGSGRKGKQRPPLSGTPEERAAVSESMQYLMKAVHGSGHTFSSSEEGGPGSSSKKEKKIRSKGTKEKDPEKEAEAQRLKQEKKEQREKDKHEKKGAAKRAKTPVGASGEADGVLFAVPAGGNLTPAAAVAQQANATVAASKPIVCHCKKSKCLKVRIYVRRSPDVPENAATPPRTVFLHVNPWRPCHPSHTLVPAVLRLLPLQQVL